MIELAKSVKPQPLPQRGTGDVWRDVITYADASDGLRADMEHRRQFGLRKYGTLLQIDNARDHAIDAYQEALDLCVYAEAERQKVLAAQPAQRRTSRHRQEKTEADAWQGIRNAAVTLADRIRDML